jgi:hypothetical protein
VTGQVDDPQPAPERQFVPVRERDVDGGGPTDPQQRTPGALQPPAPGIGAGVGIGPVDMRLLERMRVDRRAAPGLGPGKVTGVVEMAVGEEDRLDGIRGEPEPCHAPANQPWLTDETGVEQYGMALRVHQQVADAHDAADRVDAGISHCAACGH